MFKDMATIPTSPRHQETFLELVLARSRSPSRARTFLLGLAAVCALTTIAAAKNVQPILIGLDADMSSASAQSGEAIRRGAAVAIAEINATGGLLGQPLELVVRDHRGIPARGRDNIEEFATMDGLVAIVGGIHTPVALYELEAIHRHRIIYLGAWAAGTTVVDNGYNPNFVFRVSVRDQFAGGFLVDNAIAAGFRKPGLLLERTGWGRSNEKAILNALRSNGLQAARVEWFNWGTKSLAGEIERLAIAGADVVLLVANPREGLVAIRNMAAREDPRRMPVISHWGITGGDFFAQAGSVIQSLDLRFLQTYSFLAPPYPERAERFFASYRKLFSDVREPAEIRSPVGTAHAYDLVHLLASAIRQAGTADRIAVRKAMETLGRHEGLVRDYDPPFTPARHDALSAVDFCIARFDRDGRIVPEKPQ
jgi:branched-chain amino acid transport system substrate-binding protein